MIPSTELCRQLLACYYDRYMVEAPKRYRRSLQRRLGRLIDRVEQATKLPGPTLISGVFGKVNQSTGSRGYPKTVMQNALSRIENLYLSAYSSGIHPPPGQGFTRRVTSSSQQQLAKSASFAAKYGMTGQSLRTTFGFGDAPCDVLRRARYELFDDDPERLLAAIDALKQCYPLEALVLDLK